MHGVSRLSTVSEWKIAHEKMGSEFRTLPEHFRTYYFPETPSFGFASKLAGLVQSTNGLERMWRTLKGIKKMSSTTFSSEIYEVFSSIDVMETTIFAGKVFSTTPRQEVSWYDKICNLCNKEGLGHDLLCNVFYECEKGSIVSGDTLHSSCKCKKYVCYMPTDLLFAMVKEEVEKQMIFTFNDKLSLSGSLLLDQKLCNVNHVLTKSIAFRVRVQHFFFVVRGGWVIEVRD